MVIDHKSRRTEATQKSKAVLSKHSKLKRSINSHAFNLGAFEEAISTHFKHMIKTPHDPEHHSISVAHLTDLMSIADKLEETADEQRNLARQIKAAASEAREAHKKLC
jgi:hypothetical protein